jgi:hypothetical protein
VVCALSLGECMVCGVLYGCMHGSPFRHASKQEALDDDGGVWRRPVGRDVLFADLKRPIQKLRQRHISTTYGDVERRGEGCKAFAGLGICLLMPWAFENFTRVDGWRGWYSGVGRLARDKRTLAEPTSATRATKTCLRFYQEKHNQSFGKRWCRCRG